MALDGSWCAGSAVAGARADVKSPRAGFADFPRREIHLYASEADWLAHRGARLAEAEAVARRQFQCAVREWVDDDAGKEIPRDSLLRARSFAAG